MEKVYAYEKRHPLRWILLGIVSRFKTENRIRRKQS